MQYQHSMLRGCILSFAVMICGSACAASQPLVVKFNNLSQPVVLKQLDGNIFQQQDTALHVQLAPRLIVKVSRTMSTSRLKQRIAGVVQISELFLMQQEQYLLLGFTDIEQTLAALEALKYDPLILLVQPDLQQKRFQTNTEAMRLTNSTADQVLPSYLQLAKSHLDWNSEAGKGVTVAVIDDGYDLSHPEFDKLNIALHYDFNSKKLIDNKTDQSLGQHGSKVAGVLFAAHNHIAPEGLVPAATLVAIAQPDTWTSHTLQSFYIAYLAGADVINCSWHSRWLLQPVADVVNELSISGRNGKGVAVVFAAGNEGKLLTENLHEASIQSAITVGAIDLSGSSLSKSNFGAMVDLWAFGENVMSTAQAGHYSGFAGTSLSASIVSGYIALVLARNPELTLQQTLQQLKHLMES